jgi:hypothetical protein
MATLNPRRFSKPDTLRHIAREHLLAFLNPHADYFAERGVALPGVGRGDEIDYVALSQILLSPDANTPEGLADALYYVDEMSTPDGFDDLQDAIEDTELDMELDVTPADLAIQVWMADRDLVERLHARQFLVRPRSFEYYCAPTPIRPFSRPSKSALRDLESDLNEYFAKKRRGRTAKVFMYEKSDFVWFLVRHGEPFTREAVIEDGESKSKFFRPEKHDILVYNPALGEMRIHAGSKGVIELYRTRFGRHVFGDDEYLSGRSKFALEPLRADERDSLVCTDIDGMDWVKLKEYHIYWGGAHSEIEIRKSDDVYAALEQRERSFPTGGRLMKAKFLIKFTDAKQPRTVTLNAGNRAQYKRDDDADILEAWLIARGFVTNGAGGDDD